MVGVGGNFGGGILYFVVGGWLGGIRGGNRGVGIFGGRGSICGGDGGKRGGGIGIKIGVVGRDGF